MTKTLTTTENSTKQSDNTNTPPENFDFTTIADRLMTVSWSDDTHPTVVVKSVNGIPTFLITAKDTL